ncbi:alpha-L-fucosidase [Flavobacterium daemonense]|uniref:alpha-L-fucosidase n=1 Tax=Flavobacterium daemonense TaxID=1393049 RepID=UPI001185D0CA|nr:alpha-L-fucosidase [Flavobacterium daemonense]KAF2330613.1 alpha-L-fucosidase [Flavobacterium daemonense]
MKKLTLSLLLCSMLSVGMQAQSYTPTKGNLENRKEFEDDKFGMFIHFGPYSVLGNGEWVMTNQNINVTEYGRLINVFNPQDFDAKKWVGIAKSAGMKYITFTTRHHDGFSNFDTKLSDWKITNTHFKRDLLKELADECHKQGIKLFCYYSLLDWTRTDYQYETGRTGQGTGRTQKSDWDSYIRFMKGQLTELLTNYGEIGGIWFDGHWDQVDKDKNSQSKVNWHYDEIYKLIHSIQPDCLISNNHHLAPLPGEDFQAFEKDLPGKNTAGFSGESIVSQLPLETCETMNGTWGFNITDRKYKSTKELLHYLINGASLNANFLLNVGPMADGTIQPEFVQTLGEIGTWLKQNGNSIYGTRGGVMKAQDWGVFTAKDKIWFAHIINTPKQSGYIFIPEMKQKLKKCYLMDGKKELKFKQQQEGTFVYMDGVKIDPIDTIIEMEIQ